MAAAGIPTAASRTFPSSQPALAYVDRHAEPLVVKASGLAGGQGRGRLRDPRGGRRRGAGDARRRARSATRARTVVIEAFLEGEEDLGPRDHRRPRRRAPAGLPGPQAPARGRRRAQHRRAWGRTVRSPWPRRTLLERARREVLLPALEELRRRGRPFSGVLYAGLMVDHDGRALGRGVQLPPGRSRRRRSSCPWWRAGSPTRSGAVARGEGADAARRCARARRRSPRCSPSRGYPDAPGEGRRHHAPGQLPEGVTVFHAGTARGADGVLRVNGGRVLNVTAVAATLRRGAAAQPGDGGGDRVRGQDLPPRHRLARGGRGSAEFAR